MVVVLLITVFGMPDFSYRKINVLKKCSMLFANKDLYKQKHYNELLYKLKGSNRQPVINARLLYEPYHVGIYDVAS